MTDIFQENKDDLSKNQNYQNNFIWYELPIEINYIKDMYNKQKELQKYLATKGRTKQFKENCKDLVFDDVMLAIYHLHCMNTEFEELKNELVNLDLVRHSNQFDDPYYFRTCFELIDMFFFLFNIGIYTAIDIDKVVDKVMKQLNEFKNDALLTDFDPYRTLDIFEIHQVQTKLINYIDTLPWKAWKTYDLNTFAEKIDIGYYANAIYLLLNWSKRNLNISPAFLYSLYINKWAENKARQEKAELGYLGNTDTKVDNKYKLDKLGFGAP